MPTLKNPKHEKFAQLVVSGMTAQAAFTQAGYPSPQNAPRLRNNELVAKRIEELQVRNERKAEMAALSRDDLVGILTEIVHAARNRLLETATNTPKTGCRLLQLSGESTLLRSFSDSPGKGLLSWKGQRPCSCWSGG
jgi:phage terminase small subunit